MKRALIAGATGAAASRLTELLAATEGWEAVGLCRTPPAGGPAGARFVFADLQDPRSCVRAVAEAGAVTHIVYASRAPFGEGGVEDVPGNVAMLRNLLDAADGPALEHVHFVAGGKWYGLHIGPFPTPALEDDPRHLPPNFYYDQQDLVAARRAGQHWTWSSSRPNLIVDFAPGRGRNLISTLGVYAAICRELDAPFDFPGKPGAYHALMELTDASLLARATLWMMTDPCAADQAFNITNGDIFRWSRLWPLLADYFGLRRGTVRTLPMGRWMADKEPVWSRIVARHGLVPNKMDDVARWDFCDFALGFDYDVISSTTRARLAGFTGMLDTGEMLLRHLDAYRAARILP